MGRADQQLWKRIEEFKIDNEDSELTFSKRLARENAWAHSFALQAIDEYKKFVYLAMVCGHPVTPSVEVDQVWHLHLTYTQSYWDEFCGKTLGRPFHHNPTKGGKSEGKKFDQWYDRTLSSYRDQFGMEPPKEFWPDPDVRFSPKSLVRQVTSRTHWILRKPEIPLRTKPIGFLFLSIGIGGCAAVNDAIVESDYFVFILMIFIIGGIFYIARKLGGGGGNGGCGGGFFGCGGGGCSSSGCGGGGCGGCGG